MEGGILPEQIKSPKPSLVSNRTNEYENGNNVYNNPNNNITEVKIMNKNPPPFTNDAVFQNNNKKEMVTEYDRKQSELYHAQYSKHDKEQMGRELKENNERIIEYIICLRQHRDELTYLIEKQYKERKKLETEMERITYKLCLINKSMAQRIKTKNLYDETIKELENNYCHLVRDSEKILSMIKIKYEKLESMINKKTSTEEHLVNLSTEEQASGEHANYKTFKCPKLKSTFNKIGSKVSSTSNDSLT